MFIFVEFTEKITVDTLVSFILNRHLYD